MGNLSGIGTTKDLVLRDIRADSSADRKEPTNQMNREPKPFQKIVVAYDDSPAAHNALSAGIDLCKLLGTSLQTITVIEPPPAYTGLVVAVAPDVAQDIEADRRRSYEALIASAVAEGRQHSVEVSGHLVEAGEVDGVISFLQANKADLLVIGLRQHGSHVARLWSTVASLEEKAPCSVLAIHSPVERKHGGQSADQN
jgi:nucleotide-binding universal stress UspA family protein